MFNLLVMFGPQGTAFGFLFKTAEKPQKIVENYEMATDTVPGNFTTRIIIEDDYGQRAVLPISGIHGMCLSDMAKEQDAQIERALHQHKTQVKANDKAANDPLLKLKQGMMRGNPGNGLGFGPPGFNG